MRKVLLAIAILLLVPQLVSGLTVSKITVDPDGPVTQGTPVTVSFSISFPASSGETFPSAGELQMSTDLEKPQWTWTLITDGIKHPQPPSWERLLTLSGFELSYPSSTQESITVMMKGTAPDVERTQNKTLFKIGVIDDTNCNCISSSRIERTVLVINSLEIPGIIVSRNNSLTQFRKSLEEKAAMGIDTAAAEVKYLDAAQKIDRAGRLPLRRYTDAMDNLTAATQDITEGKRLLDNAWAEKEVADAMVMLEQTDSVIGWFKGNKSTAGYAGLQPILAKRDLAGSNISSAIDELERGNYAQARSRAQEAFLKANESYGDAVYSQTNELTCDLCRPPFITTRSAFFIMGTGIIAIVFGIFGFLWWKKNKNGGVP